MWNSYLKISYEALLLQIIWLKKAHICESSSRQNILLKRNLMNINFQDSLGTEREPEESGTTKIFWKSDV